MHVSTFQSADTGPICAALSHEGDAIQVVSLYFRAQMPPVRSLNEVDQRLRLRGILGRFEVYEAFGIKALPINCLGTFSYATGLETIGTLANLLMRGGIHCNFVDNHHAALRLAQDFLDSALGCQYAGAEAYSSHEPWCDWFIGEQVLDATVLIGNGGEWWLLAVTGTD